MTDITTTGKPPLVVLRDRLEARRKEIKDALPSDVSVDNFVRAVTTSAQLNPELQAVTWQSLWDACIRACRVGLLPDGLEAAIVPYKTRAQFIPMVQGVLRNARRSGQIKWIKADVVREGEEFDHAITHTGEIFRHVPGEDFAAPIVKAYALAITKDDAFYSAVMSKAEIDKHRAFSRASREDSPWNQWYEAMAIKTAIHQLGKYLPSVRDAIKDDDTIIQTPIAPTVVFERAAQAPASVDDNPRAGAPEGGERGELPPENTPAAEPDDAQIPFFEPKDKGAKR